MSDTKPATAELPNPAGQPVLKQGDKHRHGHSHGHSHDLPDTPPVGRYRRILWLALLINLAMFGVEVVASHFSGSVSLLADAADFLGDAASYALSLAVLGMAAAVRARVALFKGLTMGLFGVAVLVKALWVLRSGQAPEPWLMSTVGALALVANVAVAAMLYAWREGDANMRSVWLCSRNDAISNAAVIAAAGGVALTGSAWPDLAVAAVMGTLALTAAYSVIRQARAELRAAASTKA